MLTDHGQGSSDRAREAEGQARQAKGTSNNIPTGFGIGGLRWRPEHTQVPKYPKYRPQGGGLSKWRSRVESAEGESDRPCESLPFGLPGVCIAQCEPSKPMVPIRLSRFPHPVGITRSYSVQYVVAPPPLLATHCGGSLARSSRIATRM